MTTHPTTSKIEHLRRPSGGLGGPVGPVEIDWEPGDPRIEFHPALQQLWNALQRHQNNPRGPRS